MAESEFAYVLKHYNFVGDIIPSKLKIICPFHEDLRPPMIVDVTQGNFYCFGCQARGNVIDFIKHIEKCDDLKAMIKLHKIIKGLGGKSNFSIKPVVQMPPKRAKKEAKRYFYSLPDTDWKTMPKDHYMFKRGFNAKTLNKLDMRENFNAIYGVVAPMLDNGEFRGYVCRATEALELSGEPVSRKYLYNKGFSRSNTVVGSYTKPWVIVTEGFLDYAKLVQFGRSNSCAILGWKATDNQISKLQQHTTCIISALDNTPTGEDGTAYLSEFFDVVRFQFPDHVKDIGDLDIYDWRVAWKRTKQKVLSYNE